MCNLLYINLKYVRYLEDAPELPECLMYPIYFLCPGESSRRTQDQDLTARTFLHCPGIL